MPLRSSPAAPGRRTRRDPVVIAAAVASLLQLLIAWLPILPLGVPDEWAWSRIPYDPTNIASLFLGTVAAAPVAAAYIALSRLAAPADAAVDPPRVTGRLVSLGALAFAWLWVLQESGPRSYDGLGRSPLVLFHPSHSGYFTEARDIESLRDYLAGYESLMAEGDVLHIGTHPPGLIVGQRLLLDLFETNPGLTRFVLTTRPRSVVDTTNVITEVRAGRPADDPDRAPSPAEQAEIWAAALIVQAAAALSVIPLFHLAARSVPAAAAWRAASLWPLVPALAIFLPKADALLPLFGLSTLALWHRPSPPRWPHALGAGAVFWLGMTVSLAMLPVAALAAVLSVGQIALATSETRLRHALETLRAAALAAAAFLTLTAATYALFDMNLINVWAWNYRNHAGFYDQYDRTYWAWLLVGPIELTLAVGAPVAVVAVFALKGRLGPQKLVPASVLVVIALLWLSGKNSGEAARLWLFLMPWVLWAGASLWSGEEGRSRWSLVLPLQLAVGFLTAVRVAGFGFDEFLGPGG